jgi:hypothetical protein
MMDNIMSNGDESMRRLNTRTSGSQHEIIGLMITFNEEHFIRYSIENLLRVCDTVLVLDDSTDNTRKILEEYPNVIVYHGEDLPDVKTYRDRRQFLLDTGRLIGNTFVVIDADEILSEELIRDLNNILPKLDVGQSIFTRWYHVNGGLYSAMNNYTNEFQGIAFRDDGTNYSGRDLVHEDKIPTGWITVARNYIVFGDSALLHFGTCNRGFVESKLNYYRLMEWSEGIPISDINVKYRNGLDVSVDLHGKITYPPNINDSILNWVYLDTKYDERVKQFLLDHWSNELYQLDVFKNRSIIMFCESNIESFDYNKVVYKIEDSVRITKLKLLYNQFIWLLKHGELKRILNFFIWRLFGWYMK